MKKFNLLAELAASAEVVIGPEQHNDIIVQNKNHFAHTVFEKGTLGFGESYMSGLWDAEQLDEVFYKLIRADIGNNLNPFKLLPHAIKARLFT